MTKRTTDEAALTPASLVPAGEDRASMDAWAAELVARARDEGVALTGDGGLLTDLMRSVLQRGLEVEMAEHLGYERHAVDGRGSGNSRNGSYPKTVTTEIGEVDLAVPRDRNGTFEPATVPKHQRRLEGLSANVISLYAKGMTTGDIQAHLEEIYATTVSRETISKITAATNVYRGIDYMYSELPQGFSVCSIGATSNGARCGTIDTWRTGSGSIRANIANIVGGDSGGPLYAPQPDGMAAAVGINRGSNGSQVVASNVADHLTGFCGDCVLVGS